MAVFPIAVRWSTLANKHEEGPHRHNDARFGHGPLMLPCIRVWALATPVPARVGGCTQAREWVASKAMTWRGRGSTAIRNSCVPAQDHGTWHLGTGHGPWAPPVGSGAGTRTNRILGLENWAHINGKKNQKNSTQSGRGIAATICVFGLAGARQHSVPSRSLRSLRGPWVTPPKKKGQGGYKCVCCLDSVPNTARGSPPPRVVKQIRWCRKTGGPEEFLPAHRIYASKPHSV